MAEPSPHSPEVIEVLESRAQAPSRRWHWALHCKAGLAGAQRGGGYFVTPPTPEEKDKNVEPARPWRMPPASGAEAPRSCPWVCPGAKRHSSLLSGDHQGQGQTAQPDGWGPQKT